MGMFNIIDLKKKCPNCSAEVEWQSKSLVVDGMYPVENVLGAFAVNERLSGEAHTTCGACRSWTNLKIKDGKIIDVKTTLQNS